MADILIKHAIIITMDRNHRIVRDGAMKIGGNKIIEIGDSKDLEKKFSARKVIDASGKVVMPGLVNAHTHLSMIFGRTLAYDNYFQDWLKVQKRLVNAFTPEDWDLAETLGCIENLKNGSTCINDMNSATHNSYRESADEICLRAFEKTGVRGILSRGYLDDKTFFPDFTEAKEDIVNRMEKQMTG